MNKGIGQVNKLRVVTQGHQATAHINEKQVATFYGQPPQGGSCIGLSGGSGNGLQNTWQFANIQVVAIPPLVPIPVYCPIPPNNPRRSS